MVIEFIHLGFGNIIALNRVIALVSPNSAPIKRMINEARNKSLIIDMTNGRKTKSVLIMDTMNVALAAITPETIVSRYNLSKGNISKTPLGDIDEPPAE